MLVNIATTANNISTMHIYVHKSIVTLLSAYVQLPHQLVIHESHFIFNHTGIFNK